MAFDLLSSISPASKHWKICVRIARMWDYTGTDDQQPPIHVDLVLVDEKGNPMYAEIPSSEADKFKAVLQESKVYTFSKFFVSPSKPAYKPFPNKYMIKFMPWTNVSEVTDVPADFPHHVFTLVPFSDLSVRVGMQEYFTDVIGMIVGVSKLAYVHMASNSSDTPKRVIALKDLKNCEVKLVLWGRRALDFDADFIYDIGQDNAVVGIFVGTLMKAYTDEETLSGGSACKWYLNEDIPEINAFFDSLTDDAPKIQWISAGTESYGSARRPAQSQAKTVAELKRVDPWEAEGSNFLCTVTVASLTPSQPWWFMSCSRCHKTALPYVETYKCSGGCSTITATPKFRLCLIGTDGTDSAEFVLFGRIAQQVVGRTVISLLRFGGKLENLPREIAAVISQKFTFSVYITDRNVMQRNVSFQVNGIETSFGRQGTIPQIRDQRLLIEPSCSSSVGTSDVTKDRTCPDVECTPPGFSAGLVALTDEVPSGSKKRRAIIRHPLGAAKKLAFDDSPSKQEHAVPTKASSTAGYDAGSPAIPNQSIVSDELNVSELPAVVAKDGDPAYTDEKKKSSASASGSAHKPKAGPKKGK